jgi:hypothetical protein
MRRRFTTAPQRDLAPMPSRATDALPATALTLIATGRHELFSHAAASLFCEYFRAAILRQFSPAISAFLSPIRRRRFSPMAAFRFDFQLSPTGHAAAHSSHADFASIDAAYAADATIFMTLRHLRRFARAADAFFAFTSPLR